MVLLLSATNSTFLYVSYTIHVIIESNTSHYSFPQGLVVALFSLGSLVGALLGGPLSDWVGRRAALVTGALLAASGIIIQSAAIAIWQVALLSRIGMICFDVRLYCVHECSIACVQDVAGGKDLDRSWKWVRFGVVNS